jgi:hypothetical protein
MKKKESRYLIRVSSDRPEERSVVTGALYIGGEASSLQLVDQPAPFELSGTGRVVSGMFRSSVDSNRVHVKVLASDSEAPPQLAKMAVGRTVLLGEELARGTSLFVRTAP